MEKVVYAKINKKLIGDELEFESMKPKSQLDQPVMTMTSFNCHALHERLLVDSENLWKNEFKPLANQVDKQGKAITDIQNILKRNNLR